MDQYSAVTKGVSQVVWDCSGANVGPMWPWVCDMPILDLDEVGENKKPFYMRIV